MFDERDDEARVRFPPARFFYFPIAAPESYVIADADRSATHSTSLPFKREREVHCKGPRLFCQTTPDGAQHLSGHLGRIILAQQFSAHGFGFGLTTSRRLWWET